MCEEVKAEIRQGQLRGKKVPSAAGGEYYSFQGIPYAKPPVGPLRFRPPEQPESWNGIRDATKMGATSPGMDILLGHYTGQEDCLFINVYTSQWPVKYLKPVMVWFHGGAFMVGSGNTDMHGPDFLVAEDVLLVTLNYRLGALGFLNLEGSDVTTNNGLRDQVMALTWVKENIAEFGGDPGNVTIFGVSAGGCSVHYLMLSPYAEGLFHRVIAMSGTALLPTCYTSRTSNKRALCLAKLLGCTSVDPQQVADFLRTVPAEEIVKNQMSVLSDQEKLRAMATPFSPSEEIGIDKFLPDHPLKLMEQGKFFKVPFMTGVTSGEGKLALMGDCTGLSEIMENLESVIPWDLVSEIGTDRSRQIAARLKQFYFRNTCVNKDTLAQYVDMQSDLMFAHSMYTAVKLHVNNKSPVYVYEFDYEASPEASFFPQAPCSVPGAPHGENWIYLFYTSAKPNVYPPESAEAVVRSIMLKLWTQFARTGTVLNPVVWPPVTKNQFQYLKIGQSLKVETDLYKERMVFLDDIYSTFKRLV